MKVNADFNQRAVVHSEQMPWIDSPMPGVSRRPLDRVGNEVARATSIVRYAPSSHFSPHVHTGGEEFVVIEGTFQDEHGDFPVGSYIRNPPQSSHTPGSEDGCIIFVKLWQFEPDDRTHVRLNTNDMTELMKSETKGVSVLPLYHSDYEVVDIQIWDHNVSHSIDCKFGAEVLILDGELTENEEVFTQHSWLRLPPGKRFVAQAGDAGVRFWMKRDHLADVDTQLARLPS